MAKKPIKPVIPGDIIIDALRIQSARAAIVKYSNTLEIDIKQMGSLVNRLTDYWDSEVAKYHKENLILKINEVKAEQEKMNGNLKKYLKNVWEKYKATESVVIKNSDRFK
ncbi:MAG: hypothetical protein IJJ40_06265 [Clostridia bacterium]|nr:hypothetical protein [Clostridia bacterium]